MADKITVQTIPEGGFRKALAGIEEFAGDLRPVFRETIDIYRASIEEEYRGSFFRPASGSTIPWKTVGPFGNRPAPARPLIRSGHLLRSWLGQTSDSVEVIGKREAQFGIRGQAAVYGAVHRGSTATTVTSAQASSPEVIRVTPRQRGLLGAKYDVQLRGSTRQIIVPRRPHASENPEANTRINAAINRRVLRLAQGAPSA